MNTQCTIQKSTKADKKSILRFYKNQRYSARFIGLDQCYLLFIDKAIIGSVIISQISANHRQYFLHALVIDQYYRKQGLAKILLNYVQSRYQPLVCFADESLSPLYLANGFDKLCPAEINTKLTEQLSIRFARYLKKQLRLKVFINKVNNDKSD